MCFDSQKVVTENRRETSKIFVKSNKFYAKSDFLYIRFTFQTALKYLKR